MISRFAFCKLVGNTKPILENTRTFVAAGINKQYILEAHHKNDFVIVILSINVVNNYLSFITRSL